MMTVIDIIYPYTSDVSNVDDHIEITCVDSGRMVIPEVRVSALHPAMSAALTLVEDRRTSEAILEALRIVEERVQFLTASADSGRTLMESVFGARPPQLDITTTTDQTAEDEREGFRPLFIGAMLGLEGSYGSGGAVPATLDETMEYLTVVSMLMRRLDRAESRLN
jgi:uncharacterized protein (TIGR02391 family)